MSVFGGLEDNAPDGSLFPDPIEHPWEDSSQGPIVYGAPDHVPDATPAAGVTGDTASEEPAAASDAGADAERGPENESGETGELRDERRRRRRLAVTVTAIEATKTEPIIWFDVVTNVPQFRNAQYRDVRRTHHELQRFATHLASANPEVFVPALPPPTNAHPDGSSESSEQLRAALQKWFDRVCRTPLLASDREFLYFVEATTGYVPLEKVAPRATGLQRKMLKQLAPPPDDCVELREFRPQMKLLYEFSKEAKARLDRAAKARRALAPALGDLARTLHSRAAVDTHLGAACDKVAHAFAVAGDAEAQRALAEEATFGDTIALVSRDAYIVKETLTNRHLLMRDLQKAERATESKHADVTRLKGESGAAATRINDATTQLESASFLEQRIRKTVKRVSENLLTGRRVVLARIEQDVLEAVAQCALRTIEQERRVLAAWEAARPDVRAADPAGGLARLGREQPPRPRARSQRLAGDDWSDRSVRAVRRGPAPPPEVLDRKRAAALLSETYS